MQNSRLQRLLSLTITASATLLLISPGVAPQAAAQQDPLIETIVALEIQLQARIGVAVFDTGTGRHWEYRESERFPMSSTFKTLACAALLVRVDQGREDLNRSVTFQAADLVSYSPVTEAHTGAAGLTLNQLCDAAITVSDNTAGNLILQAIGGPQGLTRFLRTTGDQVTRLDRWETELNEAVPGDERDTTTPGAMALLLENLVLGETLTPESRSRLQQWLLGNTVGDALLRSGIPADWKIGDKTGAGGYGSRSIAAVMWPPSRQPVITTIYITETEASFDARNAAMAKLGDTIARVIESP